MSTERDKNDLSALKTVLFSQCFKEHHDELKGTMFYRGRIAGALRQLSAVVTVEYGEAIERLYKADDETAVVISKNYDMIFDNIHKLSFEELNEIAELVKSKAEQS